jgi:hypothetical protein
VSDPKLDRLLAYCALGMRLLPCWEVSPNGATCSCPKGAACGKDTGKHPVGSLVPRGKDDASADPGQVAAWHRQRPTANWAWALDRHFAIDVDSRNGGPKPDQFDQEWANLAEFTLPQTLAQLTGGGGLHLIFEQPTGAEVRNRKLSAGIEIKGVGGYALVEPSNHRFGVYRWRNWGQPIAAPPDELVALLGPSPNGSRLGSHGGNYGGEDLPAVDERGERFDPDAWLANAPQQTEGQRDYLLRGIGSMRARGLRRFEMIALAWEVAKQFTNRDPGDPWTQAYVVNLVDDVRGRYQPGTEATRTRTEEDYRRVQTYLNQTPESERLAKAPPFPIAVLPDVLRKYAEEAAQAVTCPVDFVAVGMLVVLGAAMGTRRVVEVKKDWTEAPCLWVAIVGRPGDAKSPALDQVLFPVREAEAEAYLAYRRDLKTWEDWDDDGGPRPDRPIREQFTVSDATMEALAQVLQENPRGVLLHRDEFGGWIRSMNLYRGGRGADVENFNSIWSGSPIDVRRKTTEDAYVRHPFVAVLGGIQPDRLDELASGREDGFVDRLLLVHPRAVTRQWSNVTVSDQARLAYVTLHRELRNLPEATIELTSAARARFVEWHDMFYGWLAERTGPTRGAAAKMPRYCARFALVLSQARRAEKVDLQDVLGAEKLVNYFMHSIARAAPRLVPAVGGFDRNIRDADRTARRFVEWLRAHGNTATARELQRAKVGGIRKAKDVKEVVELLAEDGKVKVETTEVGGTQTVQVTLLACKDCDDD